MNEWWANPGHIAHAYHPGPGQGDRPICGRTSLHGRAYRHSNAPRCVWCTTEGTTHA
jgi:hypothetical protein